ncbi:MAG: DUF2207 domain-containing protein [bacterium]
MIKGIKKLCFGFIMALIAGLISPKIICAKTYDYEKIEVDIAISKDGTFDVAENMEYNLDGDFGFFTRDISLKDIDYISNIEVFGDGKKLNRDEYDYSQKAGKEHIQWNFLRRDFSSEQKSWSVRYKVHGNLGFYKDHDELYWNAIFSDRDVLVKLAVVNVKLPESQKIDKMTAAIYSEQGTSGFIKKIVSPTEYYFEAHNLAPHTNFTIAAGWEKGMFNYSGIFWQYWLRWYRTLGILLPVMTFIAMYILWYEKGRDPRIDKTIIAEYSPPDNLRPLEVEVLLKENATIKGISATLIDLAVRGYLKIYEEKKNLWSPENYKFEILKEWELDNNLADYEKKILEKMFEGKKKAYILRDQIKNKSIILEKIVSLKLPPKTEENIISTEEMKNNAFGNTCGEIYNLVYKSVTRKGEFTKEPNKIRTIYVAIGIILFIGSFCMLGFLQLFNMAWAAAGLIISGLIIFTFGILMPKKTLKGAEDKYKWLCFKLYLETAEKYRLEASTPEYFEKYLPYAIIMGVENKWGKRFEGIGNIKNPSWYIPTGAHPSYINSAGNFSPSGFAKSMSSMVSSFARSSSSGGGGAGGGGCAGGGGGGGGGGAG